MGTSQSSKGSPSNVPMVPPWVSEIPLVPIQPGEIPPASMPDQGENQESPPSEAPPRLILLAPTGRFREARLNLRRFAQSGERDSMCRGLSSYIHKGYGGSETATRRLGSTIKAANVMYLALSSGENNPFAAPGSILDPILLSGCSIDDVMDAIVEATRPIDGTLDAESSRAAIKDALVEMLTVFPDADLLSLEDLHREFAIECFVAAEIFYHFELDLGRTIINNAPTATLGLERLKEVREYIRETVSASFRLLRNTGLKMVSGRIAEIVQQAIHETVQVFEEYAQ